MERTNEKQAELTIDQLDAVSGGESPKAPPELAVVPSAPKDRQTVKTFPSASIDPATVHFPH